MKGRVQAMQDLLNQITRKCVANASGLRSSDHITIECDIEQIEIIIAGILLLQQSMTGGTPANRRPT